VSGRDVVYALDAAVGAFLTAGLIPLTTSPVAYADDGDGITISSPPSPDADFMDHITKFGPLTEIAAADPDEHFDALVLSGPGFTDVLTSGIDPSDQLATLVSGLPADVTAGTVDVTVNTFEDSMNPALDSTFTIPFTDPLTELWVALLPLGF